VLTLPSVPYAVPELAQLSVWWSEAARPVLSNPSVLDDEERERWSRYRSPASAARYFGAHALARYMLGQLLDVHPSRLQFDRSCRTCGAQHGKPRLVWPVSPLDFSMSASADRVLLAISLNTRAGVDIQYRPPLLDASPLARRWLAESEHRIMSALPRQDKQVWFLQTWTRKEAVLKALGTGLSKDPRHFTLRQWDGYSMRANWTRERPDAPVFVRDLAFGDYSAAVAGIAADGIDPVQPSITKLP
jgi:4'-phosphopantetheinyl transferase